MAVKTSTRASRIPQLPNLSNKLREEDPQTYQLLKAIIERLEVQTGRGTVGDEVVTWRDLQSIGLDIQAKNATNTPYNFSNNRLPVTRWIDLLPTSVATGLGSSAPSFTVYNSPLEAYEFVGTSTDKNLLIAFQFPHGWKAGTNIIPHVHLYIPDDGTGGDLKFNCTYSWVNVNGAEPSTTTITKTQTIAASAGNQGNVILSFGEIDGSGKDFSSIFSCEIEREASDTTNDTFPSSVWLKSADLHIQVDKFGTIQQFTNRRG